MGLASDIITRVRDALLDPGGTGFRWTDAELLRHITDAQREVCAFYPEANTVTGEVTPGATDVRIDLRTALSPTIPVAILRFAAGVDEVNDRLGYELKLVEKSVMDALTPDWIGYRPTIAGFNDPAVNPYYYRAVVMDPKDALAFWLYPRAHPSFKFAVTYTAVPAAVTAAGDTLALPDQYITVLVDNVCARALSKDSLYTGAPAKAEEFRKAFVSALETMTGRRMALAPGSTKEG